ncbi:hypothetical protein KR044_002305, partial [Drosophila immigrans]
PQSLCLVAALIVCAQADGSYDNIQVVRAEQEVNPDSFKINLELDNGQKQQQEGHLQGQGEEQAIVQQGAFSWTSPEGKPIEISYVADENGYQPTGAHLPTPPPIPEAIQKAIEYISTHSAQE